MKINLSTGKALECAEGQSLLGALMNNEIYLVASCGGKGTCGKCKIRVLEGDPGQDGSGKLTGEEQAAGMALACRCLPKGDITIEIPETSKLIVGDKIALSKGSDLSALLSGFDVNKKPVLSTIELNLPAPTLNDNISDLERVRRALEEQGITDISFSHGFTMQMADTLRGHSWKVHLGYVDDHRSRQAVFVSAHDDLNRYGIAVDIGTTTVVVYLIDLAQGSLVDVGSTYNSQMRHGDDVITRIVHATETTGGLDELRRAVVADINDLLRIMLRKHGIKAKDVESAVISGNTTMAHLFWGLNPGYIREEPYIPTLNNFPFWRAGTSRMKINPQAPVYTVPCVASYVGGDIVAGVLASGINRSEQITLFMDIGTNGEVALGSSEWLVTAACSAGPCFEGSGIRHGMRATEGAIEAVRIDPETLEPEIDIIGGGQRPVGVCGSGMIDAIAEMFLTGVINQKGDFIPEKTPRIRKRDSDLEYVLFEDGGTTITLTQVDIENILRAKAAVYAGVSLLVTEMGLTMDMIEKICIAGGFGNYLNVERAIFLGMLPDLPRERFNFMGNTSASGAYLTLMSGDLRDEAEEIASKMTYIELSVSSAFMDEYMSAMFLPHTDMGRFPSVAKTMEGKI
jgi:uncharacterized 2Fe-2S/4Fe-4S cluster protein (DUF4445 family)